MIIRNKHLCTVLEVWNPRYNDQYKDEYGEAVALLHRRKAEHGTAILVIEFTKSKGLKGQRFAIRKVDALKRKLSGNKPGQLNMYEVPMSHLENWYTPDEVEYTELDTAQVKKIHPNIHKWLFEPPEQLSLIKE